MQEYKLFSLPEAIYSTNIILHCFIFICLFLILSSFFIYFLSLLLDLLRFFYYFFYVITLCKICNTAKTVKKMKHIFINRKKIDIIIIIVKVSMHNLRHYFVTKVIHIYLMVLLLVVLYNNKQYGVLICFLILLLLASSLLASTFSMLVAIFY